MTDTGVLVTLIPGTSFNNNSQRGDGAVVLDGGDDNSVLQGRNLQSFRFWNDMLSFSDGLSGVLPLSGGLNYGRLDKT